MPFTCTKEHNTLTLKIVNYPSFILLLNRVVTSPLNVALSATRNRKLNCGNIHTFVYKRQPDDTQSV
uniref:Uncharacterized protein n=1 Tax=Chlorobium phaeobacteroides (strain BS1) TaxID=331678 RepID=B3EJ49_CHLPB